MTTAKQKRHGKKQKATQVMVGLLMADEGNGLPLKEANLEEAFKVEREVSGMSMMLTQMVYTPREAESILRLSKNTINALLNSGRLRAIRCGRKWLIPRGALEEFLR